MSTNSLFVVGALTAFTFLAGVPASQASTLPVVENVARTPNAGALGWLDVDDAVSSLVKKGPCVCLASDLIGTKVDSPQGEKLGKIEDVVIHPGGEVAYAVLSFGGILGVGDKLFTIPWSALEPQVSKLSTKEKEQTPRFVLAIDKEHLKSAPGFDKSHWPSMADPDWAKDIDAYYANYRRSDSARPIPAGAHTMQPIWKSSELKGFDVHTPGGENLGDIKEIAIDTNGRVSYVVVSVGGFLGLGDRLVAVPWDALKTTTAGEKGDKRNVTLATTKERLAQAPRFEASAEKRNEMCDTSWITKVYEFYSVRPYWPRGDMDDDHDAPRSREHGGKSDNPDHHDKPPKNQ